MDMVAPVLASMVLAALYMMGDEKEALFCIYPAEGKAAMCIARLAWLIQCGVLPCAMLISIPWLMSVSYDCRESVINGMAIVFIIEVDDILYAALLSKEQCD